MLVKWMICTVDAENRQAFTQAQCAWGFTADEPGFIAQFGGWDEYQPNQACIVGCWKDLASHFKLTSLAHCHVPFIPLV